MADDKFEGRTAFIVAGNGRWGRGNDLAQAKRNYTRFGGRLSDGYQIIEFTEGSEFTGVDDMGRYFYTGPDPVTTNVAARKRR